MSVRKKDRHARRPQPRRLSVTVEAEGIAAFLAPAANRMKQGEQAAFVCIGTDCSTGDAFGPLVGSALQRLGWANVSGTMDRPLDAKRIAEEGIALPADAVIITIDACLGKSDSVGKFAVSEGSLRPGEGVGLQLDPIGDFAIAGVVNVQGPKPYWTLQATSLHLVMRMAHEAADAIHKALIAECN